MGLADIMQTRITRTIKATYGLSFLGDVCTGLFVFAISIYTSIMTDTMGASAPEREFWVGLVATGWGVVYIFSAVLMGKLSDKIGRRNSLLIAMAGFIVMNLFVLCFATHPLHLFFALCGVALFFGLVFPVLEALISELTEPYGQKFHARALSIFMIAWSIGLTLGPLIGGIFDAFLNYLIAFGYLIAHASFFVVLVICFLPSTRKMRVFKEYETQREGEHEKIDGFFTKLPRPTFRFFQAALLLLPLVFAFCNQIYFSIFPAFGDKHVTGGFIMGESTDPALVVGIVTFALGVGRTLTFWHTGRIKEDSFKKYILLAPLLMAAGSCVILFSRTADILLPAFLVYGLGTGYAYSIGFTLLMEMTRTGKGLKAGLYEGAIGAGTLASTLISTFIGQLDPTYPYVLASVFAIAISVTLVLLYTWQKRRVERFKSTSG
jgi:MFS family permease